MCKNVCAFLFSALRATCRAVLLPLDDLCLCVCFSFFCRACYMSCHLTFILSPVLMCKNVCAFFSALRATCHAVSLPLCDLCLCVKMCVFFFSLPCLLHVVPYLLTVQTKMFAIFFFLFTYINSKYFF
jgi:hypothetical protein